MSPCKLYLKFVHLLLGHLNQHYFFLPSVLHPHSHCGLIPVVICIVEGRPHTTEVWVGPLPLLVYHAGVSGGVAVVYWRCLRDWKGRWIWPYMWVGRMGLL